MSHTPIHDQTMTAQQRQAAAATAAPEPPEEPAADKAEGLPWLRFFRG